MPKGFIPAEDGGYLIIAVQAPPGASLEYTTGICSQVETILAQVPEIDSSFSVAGFSFGGSASNRALIFTGLKGFDQRKGEEHSGNAVLDRLRGPLSGIHGAQVVPFAPPAVQGLGQFGGFQFVLEDQSGTSIQALANVTQKVIQEGNQNANLSGLFSSFSANDPQFVLTFDREKAKALGVSLNQITDALQVYMGSVYVNDFEFNNRAYRVYVQADRQFRSEARDIKEYYVRSSAGVMVPLDAERTVLDALGGGCQIPIGVHCSPLHDEGVLIAWRIHAQVLSPDGETMVCLSSEVPVGISPRTLGHQVAEDLKSRGAFELLASPSAVA